MALQRIPSQQHSSSPASEGKQGTAFYSVKSFPKQETLAVKSVPKKKAIEYRMYTHFPYIILLNIHH